MKRRILIAAIVASVILGAIVWIEFFDIVDHLSDWLQKRKILMAWSLNSILFAIGLGIIPIMGFLSLTITDNYTLPNFLIQTMNVFLGVLFVFIVAFVLARQFSTPPSVLMPDYITYELFPGYWNFALYVGLFFYIGTFASWKKLNKRKTEHNTRS